MWAIGGIREVIYGVINATLDWLRIVVDARAAVSTGSAAPSSGVMVLIMAVFKAELGGLVVIASAFTSFTSSEVRYFAKSMLGAQQYVKMAAP